MRFDVYACGIAPNQASAVPVVHPRAALLCSLTPPAHEGLDAPLAKENLFVKLTCFVHEVFAVLFLDSQHPLSDRLHLDVRKYR